MSEEALKFTALDVLRAGREILRDGGDPNPCGLGVYCCRCAISIAQGDLKRKHGVKMPLEQLFHDFVFGGGSEGMWPEYPSDRPLTEARDWVGKVDGCSPVMGQTREQALAIMDKAIELANTPAEYELI